MAVDTADGEAESLPGPAMNTYMVREEALKTEALWEMNSVVNLLSYDSNKHTSVLLETMFPDSDIAKQFTCGKDKS